MAKEQVPIPEKPLTSAELNKLMYQMLRERARQDAEFRARYNPNGPTGPIGPTGSTGATGSGLTGTTGPTGASEENVSSRFSASREGGR